MKKFVVTREDGQYVDRFERRRAIIAYLCLDGDGAAWTRFSRSALIAKFDSRAKAEGAAILAKSSTLWPDNPVEVTNVVEVDEPEQPSETPAAMQELIEAAEELLTRVDTVLHAGYVGFERIARLRTALAAMAGG